MRFRPKYGSHIPVIVKLLAMTDGDVLELGSGWCSTPVMHWLCIPEKRNLVTYENDAKFFGLLHEYQHEYHQLYLVDNFDEAQIEKSWDVVLVDHGPAERRKVEIMRLKNYAKYIVVHDTLWKEEKHYQYRGILSQFRWRYDYIKVKPRTSVISNLVDLTGMDL